MISRRHFVGGAALAVASFNAGCRARQPLQATDGESRPAGVFELEELSISELQDGLRSRRWTGEQLTQLYLDRIEALDREGPRLGAIIRTNPDALAIARQLDRERQTGRTRGPLHGIPLVIKDNIETADSMPTTAGSLALRKLDSNAGRPPGVAAARRRRRRPCKDESQRMGQLQRCEFNQWVECRGRTVP